MPIMSIVKFEHFFRAAAGVDVDKADLKRFSEFINHKVHDLLVRGEAVAQANGRDLIEPYDLPITKGLQESSHRFRGLDQEIIAILNTIRAAAIDCLGGPGVLSIHWLPVLEIDTHEVLISMHTTGVGIRDAEMRAGKYPSGSERFPLVLGTDGSGTVVSVGSRIRRFTAGHAVYAYVFDNPKGGFHAEYVGVPAENVGHIAETLDLERGGATPTTGLTALQGIENTLHLTGRKGVGGRKEVAISLLRSPGAETGSGRKRGRN